VWVEGLGAAVVARRRRFPPRPVVAPAVSCDAGGGVAGCLDRPRRRHRRGNADGDAGEQRQVADAHHRAEGADGDDVPEPVDRRGPAVGDVLEQVPVGHVLGGGEARPLHGRMRDGHAPVGGDGHAVEDPADGQQADAQPHGAAAAPEVEDQPRAHQRVAHRDDREPARRRDQPGPRLHGEGQACECGRPEPQLPQAPEPPAPGVAGGQAGGYCDREERHGVGTSMPEALAPLAASTVMFFSCSEGCRETPVAAA
jgi:hypothetical protein